MIRCKLFVALAFFIAISANVFGQAEKQSPTGTWQGMIQPGAVELRFVVHIKEAADGSFNGSADSPDQGATGLTIDTINFNAPILWFEMKALQAGYEGVMTDDGSAIEGTFSQGAAKLPLRLERGAGPLVLNRPQEPKPPFPYDVIEVTYLNELEPGLEFAGTLTLPRTAEPHPAVVLITGSGPQDRDESLMGHKPFLLIADYLTRRGVAVLRADDRGVGGSTGDIANARTEDLAGDALAAVRFLRTRSEIDSGKIGLLGHSEGGIVAPIAAGTDKEIAFIVLLAGTGVTGEEILGLQSALISRAMGIDEPTITTNQQLTRDLYEIVKTEPDNDAARARMRVLMTEAVARLPEEQRPPQDALLERLGTVLTPWFRYFLTYDPRPALREVDCPVLALNGELDLQVPPKANLPEIEKALREGGNTDVTIREFAGLNHLFQNAQTGLPAEYGRVEETMDPEVLKLIGDWIEERTQ